MRLFIGTISNYQIEQLNMPIYIYKGAYPVPCTKNSYTLGYHKFLHQLVAQKVTSRKSSDNLFQ